ncbi:hypothetical protein B0T10DRAFT_46330 [Thelonectria olida]|uniref:Uncharacterized protein n=1 Tax=Thelonectria olida TaxID=1576542 RepID=A0A9P9AH61_9HYPO|nr:hypothetical protein B0T10DRAFT_46330 [Thelonectria olida]
MANEVKNYFLAPSWDYVTEANAGVTISLWNLVTSPTDTVPPLLAAKSQPKDAETLKSTKEHFQWIRERGNDKKFGVWTKFLQMIGLGLNLGHHRSKSVHLLYKFDTIETREAYPTPEYVKQMVEDPSVVRYLKKTGFEQPLYMVVGTKAVTGATVQQVEKKLTSTDASVAADLTTLGAPVSLGPEISISSNTSETLGFKKSPGFIFAFRLRKVRVNALMEIEDDGDEREGTALGEYEETVENGFDVLGVEENDSRAHESDANIGGDETEVEDNDETVYVTLPLEGQ